MQSLGSGSSGNSFLIAYANTTILLDCGIGVRTVQRVLKDRGKTVHDLAAILLTHEHSDHVRHLPQVTRSANGIDLYSSEGTARAARLSREQWTRATDGQPLTIGSLTVWPLAVKHDAAEPCGYLVETPAGRATILTDLGCWDDSLREPLLASDLVVLEANHDEEMLRRGPYPQYLKKRVLSDVGHLSNHHHAAALTGIAKTHRTGPVVWLAHLSETNNDPDLAEGTVRDALHRADRDLCVTALPRRRPGPLWTAASGEIRTPWQRPTPPPEERTAQLPLSL